MGVGVWRRGAEWASKTARGSRSGKKTSFLSFCVLRAVRLSVPRCFCGHARKRVSGAVTSVLLERPPCGRRCVRARGWLLMSSKAMGGRKAVSHQVKLGWHVKIRRRGIYFLHGGCHGASSSGAARRRWAAVPTAVGSSGIRVHVS